MTFQPQVSAAPADWLMLFERHAEHAPDAPALDAGDLVVSYAELDRWAEEIAAELDDGLPGPTPLVGVFIDRGPLAVAAILGTLKAGLAYIALDPGYARERIEYMVADSELSTVLTARSEDGGPALAARIVALAPQREGTANGNLGGARRDTDPTRLAYVVYTSGSTGRPKGSLIRHGGLASMALAQQRVFELGEGDRVLQFSSFSFDASTFEIVLALGSGATLCLAPAVDLQPGTPLLETLAERQISTLVIPPSALAKVPRRDLPALKTIAVAGEPCPASLVDAWAPGRRFLNLYGPSEATIWATWSLCLADAGEPSIGNPIEGVHTDVLDEGQRPIAEGEVGELLIGGAGVGGGYLGRPRLTAERFVPDPNGPPGARLYRTGDLVRRAGNGELDFVGRRDRQVKVRGFRVDLGEIEAALVRCGGVQQAVAVQDADDRRLVAYLLSADGAIDVAQLRESVRGHLPDHMVPARLIPVAEIPLDPNGKADVSSLPREASRDLVAAAPYVAPTDAVTQAVATLMARLLKFDVVGADDDFFRLGGDSLQAPGLIADLENAFGPRIPFDRFVEDPTPRALSKLLSAGDGAEAERAASELLQRLTARPPAAAAGEDRVKRVEREDGSGAQPQSEDAQLFLVLRSVYGDYSIWPHDSPIPTGWSQVGEVGSRDRCLDLVEATWNDPRLGFAPNGDR